ncbi:MAG: PAS domain-containing protein [Desulfonatronovibrionaceae bacterium]
MNINGILFLGNSESIGDMGDYFQPLDHKNKIFITRGRIKTRLASDDLHKASQSLSSRTSIRQSFGKRHHPDPHEDEEILERFLEVLKTDRIHLAVIVNHNMEILHTTGPVSDYFSLPSGRVSMDISKMTSRDLAIPLSTGIQKVIRKNESVNFSNIQIQLHGESKKIHMRIMPLPRKKGQQALVAVFLDPVQQRQPAQPQEEASYDLSREAEQRISDLEQELQFTRENLQATVEELETANEELQATNEELLAGNEELQSTNEELQSTNEELYSVNSEYQSKIIELTELHNDVGNLLSSSQIGTLLLDENLEIRRFSPKVTEIFKLLDTDLGRPITHIAHYIQDLDPIEIITRVQETHKESENQIQSKTGRWYLMRVVPYEVGPEVFSGTVISFVDITRLKHFQEELARSRVLLDQTQKISRTGGWELDVKTGKITWTDEVYNIYGVDKNFDPSDIEQDMQFYDPSDLPRLKKAFDLALKEARPYDLELPFTKADGTKIWIRTSGWPVQENGRVVRIYGNIMDITDMKEVQQTLRMSEKYYRKLFTEMPAAFALHEIILDDSGTPCDYRFLEVNPAFEKMTGLKSDQVIGRRVLEILPDTESYWIRRFGKVALEGGHVEFEDYSGALDRYFRVRAFCPEKSHFAVIFQDVTQEKATSRELETCREKIAELEKLTGQES